MASYLIRIFLWKRFLVGDDKELNLKGRISFGLSVLIPISGVLGAQNVFPNILGIPSLVFVAIVIVCSAVVLILDHQVQKRIIEIRKQNTKIFESCNFQRVLMKSAGKESITIKMQYLMIGLQVLNLYLAVQNIDQNLWFDVFHFIHLGLALVVGIRYLVMFQKLHKLSIMMIAGYSVLLLLFATGVFLTILDKQWFLLPATFVFLIPGFYKDYLLFKKRC